MWNRKTPYEMFTSSVGFEFESMTRADSERYVREFVSRIPARLKQLEEVVSEKEPWAADLSRNSLQPLGDWFQEMVHTRPRTSAEVAEIRSKAPSWFGDVPLGNELTVETISLSVDVGIYLGECIRATAPTKLAWRREGGSRKNMDYNRAVVGGFVKGVTYEPINIGTTVAYGVGQGRRADLVRLFDNWIQVGFESTAND